MKGAVMNLHSDNDAELVRALARGDQTAVPILFDRHAPAVTRYAWALAPTRQDVEELVQDTFVTLWQKAEAIDPPAESLLPWLLVVCKNHAANQRRKSMRHESDGLPDDLATPETDHEARDRLRWVRDEIAALSPTDREVCELCLVQGRSYSEAALTLGLSVGAVTQRVSRSRAQLRKAAMNDEH
jgi:RNA polymerase sigma factor (sigma-70 family)